MNKYRNLKVDEHTLALWLMKQSQFYVRLDYRNKHFLQEIHSYMILNWMNSNP